MLLIKLTENDKRLIFALLLIFILVFVLIGFIGMQITRLMKWQGMRMDTLTSDVVRSKVITDKKHYIKYARKKNWRLFVKQAWIPLLIILTANLILVLFMVFANRFNYNVFDYHKEGFGTLLFLFDFSQVIKTDSNSLILSWPTLINSPHFEVDAIVSYIYMTLMIVGCIWYLIALQSLISRTIRMYKLSSSVFQKSLEGYNQNEATSQIIEEQNPTTTNQL